MFSLNSHVETTFTMVSGLFLAFSIVLNERLCFPKFSLIKDNLIQVFILNFLFCFFSLLHLKFIYAFEFIIMLVKLFIFLFDLLLALV